MSGQQNMKSSVSIDTSSAQTALDKLHSELDKITKKLGAATLSSIDDNLKAQETFYKYIGDKENERRTNVERMRRAAISSIQDETKAQIAAYEERARVAKTSDSEIAKNKLAYAEQANRQISKIDTESAKRAAGPGMFQRGVTGVQNVGSKIGGPIGGLVSGAANLIAAPEISIPALLLAALIKVTEKEAQFTKTGINLAAAGFGDPSAKSGATAVSGRAFTSAIFDNGFNGALNQSQQQAIVSQMTASRTLVGQGAGGIRHNMGLFGNILPDVSKQMEVFIDVTKNLGMSQKDISKTYFQSSKIAKDLNINQLDALSAQIGMQKALRNITNDGTVAASVLDSIGGFFKRAGATEGERVTLSAGVANAGANLGLSDMAGMLAFTKGLSPTSEGMRSAIFGGVDGKGGMLGKEGGGVFGLMGDFFTKVGNQSKNPMERMFIADSLNKQFGLGIQTKMLPEFFGLAEQLRTGKMTREQFSADAEKLSNKGKELAITGMDKLVDVVDPISRIANWVDRFFTELDTRLAGIPFYKSQPKSSIHPISQSLPNQNITKKTPTATSSEVFYDGPRASGR